MAGFYADVRARLDLTELNKLNKIKSKTIDVKINTDTAVLKDLATIVKNIQSKTINIQTNTSGISGAGKAVGELTSQVQQAQMASDRFAQVQARLNQAKSNFASLSKSDYGNATAYTAMASNIAQAESAMSRYNTMVQSGSATQAELNLQLQQVGSFAQKATTQYNSLTTSIGRLEAQTASNKVMSWLTNNTKINKDPALAQSIRSVGEAMATVKDKGQLASLNKEFQNYISLAQAQGLTGNSFLTSFKQSFSAIAQFTGIYAILRTGVMRAAREMVQAIKDVDTAMIELRRVSTASDNELANYFDKATESAKKYGAAISDVINSAADWTRLGYNLEDSAKLADATTLLTRVGQGMTQEESTEGLISTLRGFQLEANEVFDIVDKINKVANTQPIDAPGLFEGLERSASSMSAANNSLDQTIALITAANSVVQDPDSVGNAFKTISMRIRGAKTDLEQAGLDTEGMATSTAKLREEIMALSGVDIMIDANTFKSTYDILDELAVKWSDLTDIQQASITELIAGSVVCRNIQKCI